MRILVTGGAGYLGTVLTPRLISAGHDVTVLDDLRHGGAALLPFFEHPGFRFVRADVRAAAWAVVYDDLHAYELAHARGDDAGEDVVRTARRKRDDVADRLGRIGLCEGGGSAESG